MSQIEKLKQQVSQELKSWQELLEGETISNVRWAVPIETESLGWDEVPLVITLESGKQFVASRDPEGNGPGCLYLFYSQDGQSQQEVLYPTDEQYIDRSAKISPDFRGVQG